MIKKKSLLNYCGLLGVSAFLSYTTIAGVKDKSSRSYGIFAPNILTCMYNVIYYK